ncbi:LD-carboxypeptidase [Kitasatospora sp. MBT63]|uniref:S66 peptidase family protein n=1 Tax=Kitasatospora sp. MBT63 TaxID=1444768 RepID=UPI000A685A20|nr:LD-carboxypeptidase [Kitasatospora sp. MBT63]
MPPPPPPAPPRVPPHLLPGDRVAVAAPAGPVDPALLARGTALLTSWGLEVTVLPHVHDRHLGHLAGRDHDRAADLTEALADPAVRAVFCARGGYGTQRTVDLVDWARLADAPPTVLAGSSDVTALHEACAVRLGTTTLHSPMPATAALTDHPANAAHLHEVLFQPEKVTELPLGAAPLSGGTAEGRLAGGNASLLAASIGTPTALPPDGCLLLLEETGEEPYRLDRILTQLLRAGVLDRAAGIVLGDFTDCGDPDEVRALLADRLGRLGVPVAAGLPAGHGELQLTVPLGTRARLTPAALRLLEPPLAARPVADHPPEAVRCAS